MGKPFCFPLSLFLGECPPPFPVFQFHLLHPSPRSDPFVQPGRQSLVFLRIFSKYFERQTLVSAPVESHFEQIFSDGGFCIRPVNGLFQAPETEGGRRGGTIKTLVGNIWNEGVGIRPTAQPLQAEVLLNFGALFQPRTYLLSSFAIAPVPVFTLTYDQPVVQTCRVQSISVRV